jgi:hypothetical protein
VSPAFTEADDWLLLSVNTGLCTVDAASAWAETSVLETAKCAVKTSPSKTEAFARTNNHSSPFWSLPMVPWVQDITPLEYE